MTEVTEIYYDIYDQDVVIVEVSGDSPESIEVGMGGPPGADGAPGADAELPAGGTTGQVLSKASNLDGDTEWTTPSDDQGFIIAMAVAL